MYLKLFIRNWWNTVGLGRMYRWILSSFRGIKVQYLLTSGAKRRRRPVLHLNSEEWRQYSPIHPTQTYRNHIVVKWKPRTFWLTNAILVLKGSTKNQYMYWRGQQKTNTCTEGVIKKPILEMQSVNFGHVSDICESTLAHFCTFFHTCVHFTSNCLKHSKTWNLLTL